MSAIIVMEIVIGLVVLAAAVRFAVRDARERSGSSVDTEPETAAPLSEVGSEVGSTETS